MTDDESRYQHFIIEKPENYEIWRLSKPDTASPTEPLQPERVQAPPWLINDIVLPVEKLQRHAARPAERTYIHVSFKSLGLS